MSEDNGNNGNSKGLMVVGEQSPTAPRSHAVATALNPNRSVLVTRPRAAKNTTKSRLGPSGSTLSYTPWTDTADMFDKAFGVGNWGMEVLSLTDKATAEKVEVVAHVRVRAVGLAFPMDAIGHGDYLLTNTNAHYAFSAESAISRALNKIGARIAPRLRVLWTKDDEQLQEFTGANPTQVTTTMNVINQLTNAGKGTDVDDLMAEYEIKMPYDTGIKELSAADVAKLQQKLATLLV